MAFLFAGILSTGIGCGSKRSASEQAKNADEKPAVAPTPPIKVEPPKPTVTRPTIISRQEWKAKPMRGEGKPNAVDCITIHHTGVAQKANFPIEKKLQNLQHFSQTESKLASGKMKPAWLDVPYHFYIAIDGKIAEGREIKFVSDTNTEYDPTNHATIVVEGTFDIEEPTAEQQESLLALVAWLSVKYQVPADRIKVHNEYAKTVCPGTNLKKTIPALREKVVELTGVIEGR